MLHILSFIYFAALFSTAAIVIVGMLLGNREAIRRALDLYQSNPVALLPLPVERMSNRTRVIRRATPAPVLRLAA
jgi:hypothetical protein